MRAKGLCGSCYAKKFYYAKPGYAEKRCEATKRWRANNLERAKTMEFEKHLRRKFGMTADEYHKMNHQQGGVCKLCQRPETTRVRKNNTSQRLAVDHCHKTGKVRGLLCFKCNTALSLIESSNVSISAIMTYLS